MNEKLQESLDQYFDTFDAGFPMIPIGISRSDKEIIDIIERCIRERKDVYELGYINLDATY